jgi:trans-aconitate methyltransferase
MTEETYALSADAAEFYESTFVPALFRGWAEHLVEAVGVAPGMTVLDVACGTGIVARTVADVTGTPETVTGVDLNEAMLAVARRLRPDLTWRAGDAASLSEADNSFDLVVSQAALMFFADRVGALREMGRVVGASGRVVVQVPGRLANSAGYLALTEVVGRHAGQPAVDLLQGYFAVGDPDRLAGLLVDAGLRVDRFESWLGATRIDSLDSFLAVELLPIADGVDEDVLQRIRHECGTALAEFVGADGLVAAPIEVHLVVAGAHQ